MFAAPLNPSDLYCMKGLYDQHDLMKFEYPIVPGNEGSGIVIKSGGGVMANRLVGKRVACVRSSDIRKDPFSLCSFKTGGTY